MSDNAFCPECGNHRVHERVAPVTHDIGHRRVEVTEDRHFFCPDCGAIIYDAAMLDENQKAIARQIRKSEGLLTPEELRAVRLKYGLTQAEMETLLQTGAKTWVRWERGKVVQSQTADQMIRQIAQNPEVLRNLISRHGVCNPVADRILAEIDHAVERRIGDRIREVLGDRVPENMVRDVARAAISEIRASRHSDYSGFAEVVNG